MNPFLHYDSVYSLTTMKKQEDSYRQFIFNFIGNEWNELLLGTANESDPSSFTHQLMKVSKNGRNYTSEEINDHVATMLVAVKFIYIFTALKSFPQWDFQGKGFYVSSKPFFWFQSLIIFEQLITGWRYHKHCPEFSVFNAGHARECSAKSCGGNQWSIRWI